MSFRCEIVTYCSIIKYSASFYRVFHNCIFNTRTSLRYVRVFAVAIPSVVCLSSVTLVHPTQGVEAFGNISSPLCTLATSDLRAKFYGGSPRGTPPSGALNARGVSKYSDFRPVSYTHLTLPTILRV